jgi:hypothetical protein
MDQQTDSSAHARRRQSRLYLWTLIALSASVAAVWLSWQRSVVTARADAISWIENHGGRAHRSQPLLRGDPVVIDGSGLMLERIGGQDQHEADIPPWRRWLGDAPIDSVWLPRDCTQRQLDQIKSLFPEASVDIFPVIPADGIGVF